MAASSMPGARLDFSGSDAILPGGFSGNRKIDVIDPEDVLSRPDDSPDSHSGIIRRS
jgi:hypothetical protein